MTILAAYMFADKLFNSHDRQITRAKKIAPSFSSLMVCDAISGSDN